MPSSSKFSLSLTPSNVSFIFNILFIYFKYFNLFSLSQLIQTTLSHSHSTISLFSITFPNLSLSLSALLKSLRTIQIHRFTFSLSLSLSRCKRIVAICTTLEVLEIPAVETFTVSFIFHFRFRFHFLVI